MTMRRYTPGDSTLSGLMLTPSVADADGAPMDAHYTLSATSGIFMKWDALLGTYVTVGTTAESDGETVVWSDQTPAADAKDPVISIALTQAGAQTTLAEAAAAARGRRRLSDRGRRADDPLKKPSRRGRPERVYRFCAISIAPETTSSRSTSFLIRRSSIFFLLTAIPAKRLTSMNGMSLTAVISAA